MAQSFIDNYFLLREADFLMEHCLRLEAILLFLVHTLLLWLVAAHIPLHLIACGTQFLLLAVIAHLTLALLVVDIILSLLWSHTSLKLASLHWLAVAVLLLHGMRELVGELLAVLAYTWLAHLFPDLAWSIVALLGWHLVTVDATLTILWLALTALEVNRENAGSVLDDLFLVPTVLVLHVDTLEIIPCRYGQIVHSVAHPVRGSCAA